MQFPTLRAEMARYGIKQKDMSELLEVTPKTLRSKMSGRSPYTNVEMKMIRDKFFPHMTIGHLFLDEDEQTKEQKTSTKYLKLIK